MRYRLPKSEAWKIERWSKIDPRNDDSIDQWNVELFGVTIAKIRRYKKNGLFELRLREDGYEPSSAWEHLSSIDIYLRQYVIDTVLS